MRRKLIDFMLTFSIIAIVIGAFVTRASSLEKVKHVDCGLIPTFSVVWVGVDTGIFKKNGLDITIITAQSTVPGIQSMLAGEAQMENPETVGDLAEGRGGTV